MVGVLDALQAKGLVSRRPDAQDRRRNVVELTVAGGAMSCCGQAQRGEHAERALLAPLRPEDAQHLRDALLQVVPGQPPRPAGPDGRLAGQAASAAE